MDRIEIDNSGALLVYIEDPDKDDPELTATAILQNLIQGNRLTFLNEFRYAKFQSRKDDVSCFQLVLYGVEEIKPGLMARIQKVANSSPLNLKTYIDVQQWFTQLTVDPGLKTFVQRSLNESLAQAINDPHKAALIRSE